MKSLYRIESRLVREEMVDYNLGITIDSARAVHNWFKKLTDSDTEKFIVIMLDNKSRITCFSIVSIGTINQCPVSIREVIKYAIMTGSVSIILLHNHPEEHQSVLPSTADENLTDRIKQAVNIMEIKLLDHIIISRDNYYSFQEHGKITI